jgi:MYXO-CTERM domain-containing protein
MRKLNLWEKSVGVCAALGAAWSLALPQTAEACGGMNCDGANPTMPVNQDSEDVLFILNPGEIEVHIQVSIDENTEAQKFSWMVPMAAPADQLTFEVGSQPLFDALRNASVPQYGLMTTQETCGDQGVSSGGSTNATAGDPNDGGSAGEGTSGDTDGGSPVVLKTQAGAFEIVVLQDKTVAPIKQWIEENDFVWIEGSDDIIQQYLNEGNLIIALKLAGGADKGDIHPIVLRYPGTENCFPLRLTRFSSVPNLDIRVFILANERAAPTNYRHVLVNPLKIDWLQLAANYKTVIQNAVDELMADGLAFVTEYAGPSDIVQAFAFNVYQPTWNEAVFSGMAPELVVNELNNQGLMSCFDEFFCQFNHPLVEGTLADFLPVPNGLTKEQFYSNLGSYVDQIDVMLWAGGDGFAKALADRVIMPGMHAQELLDTYPYLTRMYTVISPQEMIADPIFHINPDLEDVPNIRISNRLLLCDGNSVVTFPDGRELFVPNNGPWPELPGEMWWAEQIEQVALKGKPMHLVNNTAAINKKIEEWNLKYGWPRFPSESTDSGGSTGDDGTSATTGGQTENAGCGCNSDGDSNPAALLGLAGLVGLGLRRRRA